VPITGKKKKPAGKMSSHSARTVEAQPVMSEQTQNPSHQAHERYLKASREYEQTLQEHFSELLTQYCLATQSLQDELSNRLTDALNKRTEALLEANSKNEALQRCTQAAERFNATLKQSRSELVNEKSAADLRLLTEFTEAQGQPDIQSRVQRANEQYISTLQEAYQRSSVNGASEAYLEYQRALKEAVAYASQRSREVQVAFDQAVRTAWGEAAQSGRAAIEAYVTGRHKAVTDAQESSKRVNLELLHDLQAQFQKTSEQ
jgi:hypothetical protein